MRQDYYTYAYLREDGTPYYIGKGCRNRIHHPEGKSAGMPPIDRRLYLKKGLTEFDAFKHEMYMIDLYGRKDLGTGILRNRSAGGDGNMYRVVSQETRDKIGASHRGRKQSAEWIKKRQEKAGQTRAKEFLVIPMDGDPYIYKGKRNFCRDKGWPVKSGETRINEVIRGRKKTYKGYKFEDIKQ